MCGRRVMNNFHFSDCTGLSEGPVGAGEKQMKDFLEGEELVCFRSKLLTFEA